MLGTYEGGELRYVGNVGTGFTDDEIDRLLKLLKPLERPELAVRRAVPKMPKVRKGDVVWVEPKLVAEVEFVEWTHDGHLRAPSYQGLREDKAPEQVHREEPLAERDPQGQARPAADQPGQARSGRRRGSRRATCSATTATSLRCSSRTSRAGRSR